MRAESLDDEIKGELAAQQQKTKARNQKAAEELSKADKAVKLVKNTLKMNQSDEFDPDLAEETVRLYEEVHGEEEKERRGAGR